MVPVRSKICVLLATYNGERFLEAQLASLATQTLPEIDIIVGDDGSTDNTHSVLARTKDRWSKGTFEVVEGPHKGFAENFRSLSLKVRTDTDFVACCDQDDVWDPDKLEAAVTALSTVSAETPAVYFSRTLLTDENDQVFGLSPRFSRSPSFHNALVQSIGGGNTMVLNRAGAALFSETCRRTGFVTHDWWAYLVISGAGGFVYYDHMPHIRYRQHGRNLVGNNTGLSARLTRLKMLLGGRFRDWTDRNLAGLDRCADLLTPGAREVFQGFYQTRQHRGLRAVQELRALGLYRQVPLDDLSFKMAVFLGKV